MIIMPNALIYLLIYWHKSDIIVYQEELLINYCIDQLKKWSNRWLTQWLIKGGYNWKVKDLLADSIKS